MQRSSAVHRIVPSTEAATAPSEADLALKVVTVYQDSLTQHWATELWNRVGQLIGNRGVCHRFWKIGELTDLRFFTEAVQAAAEADVLVVSIRDIGDLPLNLHVWVNAWMPRRAGHAGALVALIGVPSQPDVQSGYAHAYLDTIARQAGLDFLPRERRLPEAPFALSGLVKSGQTANTIVPLPGGTFSHSPGLQLHRRLNE